MRLKDQMEHIAIDGEPLMVKDMRYMVERLKSYEKKSFWFLKTRAMESDRMQGVLL